ncbi:MAG: hypothetical protein ABI456_24070 [Ktedonobacteraceae bacterium]|nr:hypothetical protein [Chloroflexota bacterium]
MQSSDQQPVEKADSQDAREVDLSFYEFPPETPASAETPEPAPASQEAVPPTPPSLEEAVQQGLIYPPPPSFYQNLPPVPAQRAPTVPATPPAVATRPATSGNYGSWRAPAPAYPPSAPPTLPAPVSASKSSRKWIWISITVVSAILVVSCGLSFWVFYSLSNTVSQQLDSVTHVVNDYYGNIQAQNYAAAYQDLAPARSIRGLTPAQFTQQARSRDSQSGVVRSYQSATPANGTTASGQLDLSSYTVLVDITRSNSTYTVLLTVSKVGNGWKIVDFDRI